MNSGKQNKKTTITQKIIDHLIVYTIVAAIIATAYIQLDNLTKNQNRAKVKVDDSSTTMSAINKTVPDTSVKIPEVKKPKESTTKGGIVAEKDTKTTGSGINAEDKITTPSSVAVKNKKPKGEIAKSNNVVKKPEVKTNKPEDKTTKPDKSSQKPVVTSKKPEGRPIGPVIETKKPEKVDKSIKRISRSLAFSRGMDIINYVWNYNVNINGLARHKSAALPNYLKGVKTATTTGIPYCWGGYLSLDKSDNPDVKNFQEAIKKGYAAGNINCIGEYKADTAGLDCSGFVCAAFNIPNRYGTGLLSKYFEPISYKDLKPMDILNCQAEHVFIFLKETDDKKGILTMEAARNQYPENKDKTNINYRSWESISNGVDGKPYVAMRYRGIIDNKVKGFNDEHEYNNKKIYATYIKIKEQCKGYIDYVDDVDNYQLNVNQESKLVFDVSAIPNYTGITITDRDDKNIISIKSKGAYNIKLPKGIYYITVVGLKYRFNPNSQYTFSIHPPEPKKHVKQKAVKQKTVKKKSPQKKKKTTSKIV